MHGRGEAGVAVSLSPLKMASGRRRSEVAVLNAVEARLIEQSLGPVTQPPPRASSPLFISPKAIQNAHRRSGDIALRRYAPAAAHLS
jgi:hypothetical protein